MLVRIRMSRRSSADAAGALKKLMPEAPMPGCGRSQQGLERGHRELAAGLGSVIPGGSGTPSSVASIVSRMNCPRQTL